MKLKLDKQKRLNPKPNDEDNIWEGGGRHTYCHLIHYSKQWGTHRFEVRGYKWDEEKQHINISAVNWTMCAGACSVYLNEENIDQFFVLEDSPEAEILYGK